MHSPTLQALFSAVRRRLLRLRLATALRTAAWAATAILLAMALVHLFVAQVEAIVVLVAAALPWLVAMGWSARQRITPAECAAWADRHLGGASAYATLLETAGDPPPQPAAPALERLLQWVDAAVPRSLATLQALPPAMRLARPLMAMLVSVALTAILLQVPAPRTAASWIAPADAPVLQAARDDRATSARGEQPSTAAPAATEAGQDRRGQARAASPTAGLTAAKGGKDSDEQTLALATAPTTGAAGSRAAAGGREAGDSPDTVQDTGLSPSWQGELARKLQSATGTTDTVSARADPARGADYAAARRPPEVTVAVARLAPAPAAAPAARPRTRLGPAEQAYVRAYFSGSGATP